MREDPDELRPAPSRRKRRRQQGTPPRIERPWHGRPDAWELGITFAVAALAPLVLAFNGGALDAVFRAEAAVALWWAVALGLAFGVLPSSRGAALRLPLVAAAALVAWTAASLLWTETAERTFEELNRTIGYVGLLVVVGAAVHRRNWRAAAGGLAAALLILPCLSLASRLAPDMFTTTFGLEFDRLNYPLEYWNALASWAAMAIAAGLALSAHLASRALRALALAAVPISGASLYLTYSRGGLAAMAVGVLAVGVLARRRWTLALHTAVAAAATGGVIVLIRSQAEIADASGGEGGGIVAAGVLAAAVVCASVARWTAVADAPRLRIGRRTGRIIAGAALVACVGSIVVVGPGVTGAVREQLSSSGYPAVEDDPASRLTSLEGSRDEVWASAGRAFASEPLTGIGPGSFAFWYSRDGPGVEAVRDAHSLYLETLAELGIPGLVFALVLLGGLVGVASRAARRSHATSDLGLRAALVGAFIVFLFHAGIDWLWESTAVAAIALSGAAVVAASTLPERVGRRVVSLRRVVAAGIAIAAGAIQIPAIVATERVRASLSALAIGDDEGALESADEAVSAEPWAATPYAVRSMVNLQLGRLERAREDARVAIDHEPTNWQHRVMLARVLDAAGDNAGSERALDDAMRLRSPEP